MKVGPFWAYDNDSEAGSRFNQVFVRIAMTHLVILYEEKGGFVALLARGGHVRSVQRQTMMRSWLFSVSCVGKDQFFFMLRLSVVRCSPVVHLSL